MSRPRLLNRVVVAQRAPDCPTTIHFFPHGGMGDRVVFQAIVGQVVQELEALHRTVVIIPYHNGEYDANDYEPRPDEIWVLSNRVCGVTEGRRMADSFYELAAGYFPRADEIGIVYYGATTTEDSRPPVRQLEPYALLERLASEESVYPEFHLRPEVLACVRDRLASCGLNPSTDMLVALHCRQERFDTSKNPRVSEMTAVASLVRGRMGGRVVLVGGNDVPADLEELASLRSPVDPTLQTPAWLLKLCDLFIGGDSGPGHLAAAVGTPVVSIQDPARGSRWGPFCPPHRLARVEGRSVATAGTQELSFAPQLILEEASRLLKR